MKCGLVDYLKCALSLLSGVKHYRVFTIKLPRGHALPMHPSLQAACDRFVATSCDM